MKKLCVFVTSLIFCFGVELNFAPKIENPLEEKRFVVVVASFNNQKYAKGNLESIFSQEYANFRVIYTNDASTDNTTKVVQNFVANDTREIDFTYIENKTNRGAMYNYYAMVTSCENDEIIVIVDGDDKLKYNGVLKRLNQAYADDDVWMTYGQDTSRLIPKGHSKPTPKSNLEEGSFRRLNYRWSHLRTYYAGLFKTIPEENWIHEGEFYPIAQDVAQIFFLMDRAREHVYFIPEVLCDYNITNPLNDFRRPGRRQWKYRNIIIKKPALGRLYSKAEFL